MWKVDEGSRTGTTTESYVSALDWKVAELSSKTILLKNTHASLSLKYKLLSYAVDGGIDKELVAETTLGPGRWLSFTMIGNGIDWCYRLLMVADMRRTP